MAVEEKVIVEITLQRLVKDFIEASDDDRQAKFESLTAFLEENRPDLSTETLLELTQRLRAFITENATDHTATSCAITSYVLGMKLVSTGQPLSHAAYTWLTNIGLLFSFGCALSFVSSSFELVQEYRRDHMRMKIIIQNQKIMEFMLRAWVVKQNDSPVIAILKALKQLAEAHVETLQHKTNTNLLHEHGPFLREDYEEKDEINVEINKLEDEIVHNAQATVTMIQQLIDKAEGKSGFSFTLFPETEVEKLKRELDEYTTSLEDVLHRPLYDVELNEALHDRINTLSSTSLYGLRAKTLREMAIYFSLTTQGKETARLNDQDLASLFIENNETLKIGESVNSNIFSGIWNQYHRIQHKIDHQYARYLDNGIEKNKRIAHLRIHYFHLLGDLNAINHQIKMIEEKKNSATFIKDSLHEDKDQQLPQDGTLNTQKRDHAENKNPDSNQKNDVLFHVKAPDTQTTYQLFNEGKDFFKTVYKGISLGITNLLNPDDGKYQYLTREKGVFFLNPRLWGYHCKCGLWAIKNIPIVHPVLAGIYLFLNIPYFIGYTLKRFGNLLTHLEKVVNAIHKTVRDIDHALAHRSGDNPFVTLVVRWPMKIVWAAVTFIPQTILGFIYWVLSGIGLVLKTENNIAKTSRAINPSWLADSIEKWYLSARKRKDKALMLEVLLEKVIASRNDNPQILKAFIAKELETTEGKDLEYRQTLESFRKCGDKDIIISKLDTLATDYRFTYNMTLFFLYISVFLGGIYNTFATPIKKCTPWGNDRQVQHSRHQLSVAGKIVWGKIKKGCYALYVDPIISAWKQQQESHSKIDAEYPDSWVIAPCQHLKLYVEFAGLFILNTLFLATFRFIVNIAKTAPLITVSAITTSVLFAGITLPVVGTLAFTGKTQMALGFSALASDMNNGSHDGYNLAASILAKDHMDHVEMQALKHVNNTNVDDFNAWKSVYEKVELGKIFLKDLQHKINDKAQGSYSYIHGKRVSDALNQVYTRDQDMARTILAGHLAYFLVNTSKTGKSEKWKKDQYNYLFEHFNSKQNTTMTRVIEKMLPDIMTTLSEEAFPLQIKKYYIAGFCAQFAYAYAYKLTEQIHHHYVDHDNKFELYLLDQQGLSIQAKRDTLNQNKFTFEYKDIAIRAHKLSLWERFMLMLSGKKALIIDGFEISGLKDTKQDYHLVFKNTAYIVNLSEGLHAAATHTKNPLILSVESCQSQHAQHNLKTEII